MLFGRSAHVALFATPGRRDREIAERALRTLGSMHLKEKIYTNLSGGEQQMGIIAREVGQEPEVLVMCATSSKLDCGGQSSVVHQRQEIETAAK